MLPRFAVVLAVSLTVGSCRPLGVHELSDRTADQFGSRIFCIEDLDGDGIEEYVAGDDSYAFLPQSRPL